MDITRGKISAKNGFELEQEGQEPTRRDDGDGAQREEQVRLGERGCGVRSYFPPNARGH